jgi:hypothetical protein
MESISRLTSRSSSRTSACPLSSIAISPSEKGPDPPTRGCPLTGRGWHDALGWGCVVTINPSQNAGFESAKLQLWLANCIHADMSQRILPAGFIAPCPPIKTDNWPPAANGCTRLRTTAHARRSQAAHATEPLACMRFVCSRGLALARP